MAAFHPHLHPPIAPKDCQDLRDFHASSPSGERAIATRVDADPRENFRCLPAREDYRGIGPMSTTIADAAAREAALDPRRSFIVQAPAGSGKTALLVRRYSALLETVQKPEEIIAITFTIKAAAEMRARVLKKLSNSAEIGHRLRIQTIDATLPPRTLWSRWSAERSAALASASLSCSRSEVPRSCSACAATCRSSSRTRTRR